ncbi:hypothetical protein P175DRAFT_0199286 [Aspergillus ochraceoroseus IBT 24754]|uniref:TLC domain-containing protein n=1 Tax=Aspergillus ochraceoroseus IBT 24754 TaxID=1392256 RepID=A0A2T5LZR1_9EURO|nr:uncharacterized protein P175DRAFT_0199286 [Aspergillus ochraceoroseus IBT 24754]PTU21771.1 hypothetical protein P175DRAFT_0199286 [Aspergillus ochraceoroseus IBT 24754]
MFISFSFLFTWAALWVCFVFCDAYVWEFDYMAHAAFTVMYAMGQAGLVDHGLLTAVFLTHNLIIRWVAHRLYIPHALYLFLAEKGKMRYTAPYYLHQVAFNMIDRDHCPRIVYPLVRLVVPTA